MPMTTLPTFVDLMNPLMEALGKLGGSGSIEEIYAKTVEITELPEEILEQLHEPQKKQSNRSWVSPCLGADVSQKVRIA